ncbi:MAG: hypothetical protein JWL81_2218, partial [Verrucomicrobiales bacterium]|nr:hypothetical protein [Verrucomicrobiales bacterium]
KIGNRYSTRLEQGPLAVWTRLEYGCMTAAILIGPMVPAAGFALWMLGFTSSRLLYFRAVDAPKMPGGVTL